jgi:hypothetical protein
MAFMLVLSTESRADGTAVAGLLTCKKTGDGMTYFLFSKHPVTCTYDGVGGPQTYQGISGIGLGVDLDFDKEAAMGYMVLGGSSTNKNSLSGTYVGGKAQATVGLGLGAQGGLAGAGNGFVLVPLGLGGQAMGFGAAAGISYLQLQ